MTYKTQGFSDTNQMDFFLNGGVAGGVDVRKALGKIGKDLGMGLFGLNGLTLIINGSTVTFVDAADKGLSLETIRALIAAGVAGTTVTWADGKLQVAHATSVTVNKDGTANKVFGFSKAVDSLAVPINPPDGAPPRITTIGAGPHADAFYVTVEEA